MKAIIQNGYGDPHDVLSLEETDPPEIREDEVLVRVKAASVHADIWHMVTGKPFVLRLMGAGFFKPNHRIPGIDLSGVVEATGKNVTEFQRGDHVFGESHAGIQWKNGGAYAELAAVPQSALALKPDNVTFEQAASVAASGYIALMNFPWEDKLNANSRVLINGAGGGVGAIALQIAKSSGAFVAAVDIPEKKGMLQNLGAGRFIDYQTEPVMQLKEKFDLVFDVASNLPYPACRRLLTESGYYVFIGHDHYGKRVGSWLGSVPRALRLTFRAFFDKHLLPPDFSIPPKKTFMNRLKTMMEKKQLTPIVGKTFPLAEAAVALEYLDSGHVAGKIILTVS